MSQEEIALFQNRVKLVEEYLQSKRLYYGETPRASGSPSWAVALNNHTVSKKQSVTLQEELAETINQFHQTCASLIKAAFLVNPDSEALLQLQKYLTAGVPESVVTLWKRAAGHHSNVFSSRPDIVIDVHDDFHIIEYNTDGGADKGNTHGVNAYSGYINSQQVLGRGLAQAFVDEIRTRYQGEKKKMLVVTVVPDDYRTEYEAQNRYFAGEASAYGEQFGIEWVVARLSEIQILQNGVALSLEGTSYPIDIIDREFKLPGFTKNNDFEKEAGLLQAVLDDKVSIIGSFLPFQDKLLLSTLFDDNFSLAFGENNLTRLRTLHAETGVIDYEKDYVQLDVRYSLDDIRKLKPAFDMVLKRGGDTIGSTGSKGLAISSDCSAEEWNNAIDQALDEPRNGGSYWIIQKFYHSKAFPVKYIKNSRSLPKELSVINRTAPYYVRSGAGFQLGNVLVTAGTDMETYNKKRGNIHGLRRNAYQAVTEE